jgi:hypothetical protein
MRGRYSCGMIGYNNDKYRHIDIIITLLHLLRSCQYKILPILSRSAFHFLVFLCFTGNVDKVFFQMYRSARSSTCKTILLIFYFAKIHAKFLQQTRNLQICGLAATLFRKYDLYRVYMYQQCLSFRKNTFETSNR